MVFKITSSFRIAAITATVLKIKLNLPANTDYF